MEEAQKDLAEQAPLTLIREHDLAKRWDKSVRTLQRWRAMGQGPSYICIGGSVRYRLGDILDYEDRQRRGGEAAE